MSIKQMSAVWEKAVTDDPSTLLVMLALADWANDQGVCWPAIESIAEKCRISDRQAQRIIKSLEECGALEVTRKRGRKHTNTYKLKVPTCQVLFSVKPVTDDTFLEEKVTAKPEKVTFEAIKGDIAVSPEPSEPSKPEPSKPKAQAPFDLPDWIPTESWEGFIDMRRRIRKPLTDRAKRMIVKELESLKARGHPAGEVLDQSVMHSWQGVFELRNGNGRMGLGAGRGNGINADSAAGVARVGAGAPSRFADKDCRICGGSTWDTTTGKAVRCQCFKAGVKAHAGNG